MRILIASQYFTPEVTAASARMHTFAAGLAGRGHDVEVVCEVPSHPQGVIAEGYRGRAVVRREFDGFRVSYVRVHATPSKRARSRIANYASYAGSALLTGSWMRGMDVVVASSPPLSVGAVGAGLAARHRAPWVFDVRDLWPDMAVVVGQLNEGSRALAATELLERRLYRSAAAIVAVTEPWAELIRRRGGGGKVHLIPNGTTRNWLEQAGKEPDRAGLGLHDDRFVWTYAGNIGLTQGLGAAIEAARLLGEGYQLMLVGEGPMKGELRSLAADLPGDTVAFRDSVPPAEAARLMRASDALLVPLAAWEGLRGMVPSKLFDSCAVGRPVVVAAPGEASRLAAEAGAALTVAPEDPEALAGAIRRLAAEPDLRNRLGVAGHAFAESYERSLGAARLDALLSEVVS